MLGMSVDPVRAISILARLRAFSMVVKRSPQDVDLLRFYQETASAAEALHG